MRRHQLIIFLVLWLAATARAQEATTTTISLPRVENKKFNDPYTLTDSKLRVEDGSLSRYSIKSKIVYRGPELGDWSAPDQPNPDGSIGNYSQLMKGVLTARYRLDGDRALTAGAGFILNHPFHGMDRTDLKDPFMTYDLASRWREMQFRNSPGFTLTSSPEHLATGEVGLLTFDQSIAFDFDKASPWAFTLDSNLTGYVYKRPYVNGTTKSGGDGNARSYSISAFPAGKYTFSDAIYSYAGVQLEWANPRLLTDKMALLASSPYMRLGIAYVIDRKIYLTPYLDTYLSHLSTELTTLNFQTVFSVF